MFFRGEFIVKSIIEETYLTDAQLKAELERCEYCEEKPCKEACPANCSAADFIMAAKVFEKQDIQRTAALIMKDNPLGGVCGVVCPDRFCMDACSHKLFDVPINIPSVQATIIKKAKELGGIPVFNKVPRNNKKVAVIGAGPAGLSCAALLSQKGYRVDIFEKERVAGGMCNLIPEYRLSKDVLKTDIDFILSLGDIKIHTSKTISDPFKLLKKGYNAVLVSVGLWEPLLPGIINQNLAIDSIKYLKNPKRYKVKGLNVAIIGGGAVATDCAVTAKQQKAKRVEMFALEKLSEMPLTKKEMKEIFENGIEVSGRTKVLEILKKEGKVKGLKIIKVTLPPKVKFNLKDIKEVKGTEQMLSRIDFVIIAIGNKPKMKIFKDKRVFYAGDCVNGPKTVVESVASGKNIALEIDSFLTNQKKPGIEKSTKSRVSLPGYVKLPVSLETDFFGRKILSPFLLSAAPPTDGLEEMRKAYKVGWAGGIMKTSFDNVAIHIPSEYMHVFDKYTYGNCDNVSGHPLDRVCKEVEILIKEYPDRLTMASTGGPVTGNDEKDKIQWQSNTKKLENAGCMGIEYSLSCPQGGDGTEGDIVSQNASLTAKIIDWVMEISNPAIPKLFKLTSAVTSIYPIANAIKKVFSKYPDKKAGITLANTFPTLFFRKGIKKEWEDGIIVGMSGLGVLPISYLTLSNVSKSGLIVSGNGGVISYKDAANFLALGVNSVQVCTVVTKHGYGIIDELTNGLSYLMQERGIKSIDSLRGIAIPEPIRGFMELSAVKKISAFNHEICVSCGNCTRCPYLAITLNIDKKPESDPAKCIGCSLCEKKCFTGAIYMRERTKKELAMLKEA
ncbi:MAG: FAD-dependent oxidoreductase [Candidatus Hydrogenedentota bacterium]